MSIFDPCSGGHPGGGYYDDSGPRLVRRCRRCDRELDLDPCGCGEEGHEGLSRSFCPNAFGDTFIDVSRCGPCMRGDHVHCTGFAGGYCECRRCRAAWLVCSGLIVVG